MNDQVAAAVFRECAVRCVQTYVDGGDRYHLGQADAFTAAALHLVGAVALEALELEPALEPALERLVDQVLELVKRAPAA